MNFIPYKTVKSDASFEFTEKKSVFICNVRAVSTEIQAHNFIAGIKESTRGASHNVNAYIIRDTNIIRFDDDGEPSGTSGMPTLNVLQKQGLVNVCAVTTRYFGGILLGSGGLVRAYTNAVTGALEKAGCDLYEKFEVFEIYCGYNIYEKINYFNTHIKIKTEKIDYTDTVTLTLAIRGSEYEKYISDIKNLTDNKIKIKLFEPRYDIY